MKILFPIFFIMFSITAGANTNCIEQFEAQKIITDNLSTIESALKIELKSEEAKYYTQRIVESAWAGLQGDSKGYVLTKLNNNEYSYCAVGSDLFFTVSVSCAENFAFSSECVD